ncbi:hypothetical protein TUM18999_01750 [Pseudomonas tohonis]|uniref:Uncharacterized protein n=1 Tax=Pseudomonas tohonis TaxID=2725477 RepID=A0A6J4DZ02_9PSED|nr:hypothetical protein TUM18999_01750 [Pseudomonas tohonis]
MRALLYGLDTIGPARDRWERAEMLSYLHIQAKQYDLLVVPTSKGIRHDRGGAALQKVLCSWRGALPDVYANDACRKSEVMPGLFLG